MQKDSPSFSQYIIVIKHETHSVAVSVNSADALAEGRFQFGKGLEQHVRQDCPFQMAPESLNQVQARTVRRQPVNCDSIGIGLEPFLDRSCVVEPAVIGHQANLAAGVRPDQGHKEEEKIHAAFAAGNCVGYLARRVINAAVHHLLLILTRCWDLWLFPDSRPHPRQRRMPVNFDFVLEDESFRGILLQGFFFNRRNCSFAFAYAASSRFPFMVCLGR
jgi:hypothetical protein